MDQKKMIERWIKQIKTGEISPEALGLGSDKQKALVKLKDQLNKTTLITKKHSDK